ncbi:MAG: hypothetical protein JWL84_6213, partial [Rhodospirillales bacterium]|nr:hypothetical protein [Rhodospirillales bacterium]
MFFRTSASAVAVFGVMAPLACNAAHYDIGLGSAYSYHALNELNWSGIRPGDEIVIHSGTYATGAFQNIWLPHGSATNPVRIHGATNEPVPTIQDTVFFNGAVGVRLERVRIAPTIVPANGASDAITVANGSHGVVISGCEISGRDQPRVPSGSGGGPSGINVYPGNGATIELNDIHDSQNDGVGVTKPNKPDVTTYPSVIRSNRIHHNKVHGIELNADNNSVLHNTVWSNGNVQGTYDGTRKSELGTFGTSGIHILTGQNNEIGYNIVFDQRTQGIDGNGIEADYNANNNRIYFNVVYRNDGAGILVFHSSGNRVINNTLYGNGRNSLNSRQIDKGNFIPITGGSDLSIWGGGDSGQTDSNVMANNLVYSVPPTIANYTVSGLASDFHAANGNNLVENNVFWSLNGAMLYNWTDKGNIAFTGTSVSTWNNTLKPTAWSGSSDFSMDPQLANPSALDASSPPGTALTLTSGSPETVRCGGIDFGATSDI